MKKLLSILCLVFLVSYSYAKEVPSHRLIKNGGVTFEMGLNNPFTGTSTTYFENAQPKIITTYKKGIAVEDTTFEYYENGQLQSKENYKDGKKDGLLEEYYDNGQLWFKGNYKNGKQDGLHELFHENGQLKEKGNYKDGKEDGLWEFFYENGQLEIRGNYKDGEWSE